MKRLVGQSLNGFFASIPGGYYVLKILSTEFAKRRGLLISPTNTIVLRQVQPLAVDWTRPAAR